MVFRQDIDTPPKLQIAHNQLPQKICHQAFFFTGVILSGSYQFLLVGLKTALVEADDFASGTSSRSTKLIHGGVRYLQKAILNLDIEQYRMVKEALHERTNMLTAAPHLTHPLPIMLPVYK